MASWECTTLPNDRSGGTIERQYEWCYDGRTFTWEAAFPEPLYETQRRRHRIYDYGAYVADEFTRQLFTNLAEEIRSVASRNGYDRRETAEFAARFVQSLPYTVDSVSTGYDNYPRYPVETLVDETGDCEDTSLLLSAILHGLGYRVGMLEFDSHLGVGVELGGTPGNITFDGVEYTYIEPTDTSWEIGQLPPRLDGEQVTLHRVDDSPALYAYWEGDTRGDRFACRGSLLNAGEGTARDVLFQVLLTDRHGEMVTAVETEWRTIGPDAQETWTDDVYVESDRLVTPEWRVGVGGILHDQGEAERRRT